MQNQSLRYTNTTPSVDLYFFSAAGAVTTLTHESVGFSLAFQRAFNEAAVPLTPLVAQTVTGPWTERGFVHRAGGTYRLDLPVAANAAGLPHVEIIATGLPAGVFMAPVVVVLTPDDFTVAAPTAGSVATAVWNAATRELTGLAAAIREAIADTLLGRNVAGGSNGERTVSLFFFKGVNRWLRRGTNNNTLDIYGVNDTTVVATETLTLDANGTVIGSDPA